MPEDIEPLVPSHVDLRQLPWMRLDTVRLLDSDLFALSSGDEFKAAVALWCKSWAQRPAASLPTDDRILRKLAGVDTMPAWMKLKAIALRGWVLCGDGRLYHPVVAEQALVAWEESQQYRTNKEAAAERKRNERAERAELFAILRAAGQAPSWKAKTAELRELVEKVTDLSRVTGSDESQGQEGTGHAPVAAKKGRDVTGRDETEALEALARTPHADEQTVTVVDGNGLPVPPAQSAIAVLTAAQSAEVVKACIALRKMGALRFHPGDEVLATLVLERFTAEQVVRCAGEKALRDAGLLNDPDVTPELPELLINGATQQAMRLTDAQYTAVRSAVTRVSIGYIASTLRGRRLDAQANPGENHGQATSAPHSAAVGKRSVVERVRAANAAAEARDRSIESAGTCFAR
jgi:hypothetical protein